MPPRRRIRASRQSYGDNMETESPLRRKSVIYMKSDKAQLLLESRMAMRLPTDMSPDVRTECGFAVVTPTLCADDGVLPDVVGVPKGACE